MSFVTWNSIITVFGKITQLLRGKINSNLSVISFDNSKKDILKYVVILLKYLKEVSIIIYHKETLSIKSSKKLETISIEEMFSSKEKGPV